MAIASSRPGGRTVKLAVGNRHPVGRLVAQDKVLAADERGLDVVDPDEVGAVQSDGITTPDVLRVQVGDPNVLDDDVRSTALDVKTLALDDTG